MTPEELHRHTERLGILCGNDKPTAEQIKLAEGDVERFRKQKLLEEVAEEMRK